MYNCSFPEAEFYQQSAERELFVTCLNNPVYYALGVTSHIKKILYTMKVPSAKDTKAKY